MNDLLSDLEKEIIISRLKIHAKEILNNSCSNIKNIKDAISFAYGWFMLIFGVEYSLIEEKLNKLLEQSKKGQIKYNIESLIEPALNFAKILDLKIDQITNIKIDQKQLELNSKEFKKFISNIFVPFLYKIQKSIIQLDIIPEDMQKIFIVNLVDELVVY